MFALLGQSSLGGNQSVTKAGRHIIDEANTQPVVKEKIVIDHVWSGHPVGFSLMTHDERQYVAYYNKDRQMVCGMRLLTESQFTLAVVKSKLDRPAKTGRDESSTILGWDSHNSIKMAVDQNGYIHLAGNMHVNRLTYFRTTKPYDITTFKQVDAMVGKNERRCTYPKFMHAPNGNLVFHYRDGSSGNGSEIYNIYDTKTETWQRLLDTPLADGLGKMNAYINGPVQGPNGFYHASWVWRNTFDCATNHDLSYAKSKDLVHWQTAGGKPLTLPITINDTEVIVDPIPVSGGIINGNGQIGFDVNGQAVLTYHKFDGNGKTQIYTARYEKDQWRIYQVTDWDYRWFFSGGGSIESYDVKVGRIGVKDDMLILDYRNKKHGAGRWLLDNERFRIVGKTKKEKTVPSVIQKTISTFPGMGVRWTSDSGKAVDGSRYLLRHETLGRNRDRPRTGLLPKASELVLFLVVSK